MAASTRKEYNTFVKGLITEAGPLTFPENASLDEENCVLNREGSRQRRLGMDFEEGFALRSATITATTAVTVMRWENAANNPSFQYAVVQVGNVLYVHDANATSISNNIRATLTISGFDGTTECEGANGSGYLFITNGRTDPLYLAYDPVADTFSLGSIAILIRDQFGVDDGLAVNAQPTSLSVAHNYNLLNQGWPQATITAYSTSRSRQPSNAMQWFVGKDTNDNFDPALLDKQDFGTTPAPRGRIVISAFNRKASRDTATGLSTPADNETGRPSCVAFAFERVFYSGVQSSILSTSLTQPNMTGFVFYSRAVRAPRDFGQCHTDADPTSEIDSELVDTDGGFINIPSSGKIYALVPKGPYLLVMAEQGVWAITGDDGGFRATSSQVVKLSDFGCINNSSVVDMEDGVMYWNRGGIYAVLPNDSGALEVKNITENTIQRFFNSLSFAAKRGAVGSYDPVNRRVQWLYAVDPNYDGVTFKNKFTHELVLDTVLGAFYKHSLAAVGAVSPYVAGYVECPNFVTRQEGVATTVDSVTKYLTIQFLNPTTGAAVYTFSFYKDIKFRDWRSIDNIGATYLSFLETGHEIAGDTARNKQVPYLTTNFRRSERTALLDGGVIVPQVSGSCFVQAKWDWSDNGVSGKWGAKQQAYRLLRPILLPSTPGPIDYGFDVISNKTRIPGRGKALSLRFESEDGKDFYLYGWAISLTGNTNV
jgi:hypothetical protein